MEDDFKCRQLPIEGNLKNLDGGMSKQLLDRSYHSMKPRQSGLKQFKNLKTTSIGRQPQKLNGGISQKVVVRSNPTLKLRLSEPNKTIRNPSMEFCRKLNIRIKRLNKSY